MTITNRIGLDYRPDGDENWGPAHRSVRLALDRLLCPQNVFFVSPEFTPENIYLAGNPSDRRHFATIQSAISAWEAGGFSLATGGMILVYPGVYAENLVVTKSVVLVALHSYSIEGMGMLLGSGAATSLITFQPPAGQAHSLVFKGFSFANYAAAYGSEISTSVPMLLRTFDQGVGNYSAYPSKVVFDDCNFRLTEGNNNSWATGASILANNWATFRRCRFFWPSAAGGYYVRYPFYVRGNSDTDRWGNLSLRDCEVFHGPFASPSNATVFKELGASGQVTRSSFNRDFTNSLYLHGGNAAAMVGLNGSTDAAARGNLVGINVVEW